MSTLLGSYAGLNAESQTAVVGGVVTSYPFTMGGWVRREREGVTEAFMSLSDPSDSSKYYYIGIASTNKLLITAANPTWRTVQGSSFLIDDGWVHLMGVYESDISKKLYRNGVLDTTLTASVSFAPTSTSFAIGAHQSSVPASYFKGKEADVQFYNSALTQLEIGAIYSGIPIEQQPIGHWVRHGGLGPAASGDHILNIANSGDRDRDLNVVTSNSPIMQDSGIGFSGGGLKQTAAAWGGVCSSPLDIFVACKLDATGTTNTMSIFNSDDSQVSLKVHSGDICYMNAGSDLNTGFSINDTDWHIYHCQFNGATSILYVDGDPAVTGVGGIPAATGDAGTNDLAGLAMGSNAALNDEFFQGTIGDLVIYTGGPVTDNERTIATNYLKTIYGV